MYVNEWVEIRAVLTNDVSSPHLSVGVRVPCMGAVNHGHEHHGYDGHHHGYDNGYDGNHDRHEHHWHYGNYRNHHWYEHYGNYRNHNRHEYNGYDRHHHKHPPKHPAP